MEGKPLVALINSKSELERGRVHDAFVKDQPVTFVVGSHFKTLGGRIACKEVGVDYIDVGSIFFEWVGAQLGAYQRTQSSLLP